MASVPYSLARRRLADAHFHLLNFVQAGDGLASFLRAMDEANVQDAMVSGMGVCKKWSSWDEVEPNYYLDDESRVYPYSATDLLVHHEVTALAESDRARFHPFICGFDPTDRRAIDHIKRMIAVFPNFWQGIGEVFARHGTLTSMMYDEPGRANHVALDPIYELAADLDLPVSIHSDASSTSAVEKAIYLDELADAVRKHPRTKVIWCHAGLNRNLVVPTIVADVRRLLSEHQNLYVDLSWVVFEQCLVSNGLPVRDWVTLIGEFPTRFMIGSDTVGSVRSYVPTMTRYNVLLEALEPQTAANVAARNFLAVLPRLPASLSNA